MLDRRREMKITLKEDPNLLPGVFSISATEKVRFSKGNLQAVIGSYNSTTKIATASSGKLAEHQGDYIGESGNTLKKGSTSDLFGWVGASASYNSYGLCGQTGTNNKYYGTSSYEKIKTEGGNIPGVVNAIGNGYSTLGQVQGNYLISQRTNATQKYSCCMIYTGSDYIVGLVLLPDNGVKPNNCTIYTGIDPSSYMNRIYYTNVSSGSTNAGVDMENAGAVFLCAAGRRSGTTGDPIYYIYPGITQTSLCATYQSFTGYVIAQNVIFRYVDDDDDGSTCGTSYSSRAFGGAVRLVKAV